MQTRRNPASETRSISKKVGMAAALVTVVAFHLICEAPISTPDTEGSSLEYSHAGFRRVLKILDTSMTATHIKENGIVVRQISS